MISLAWTWVYKPSFESDQLTIGNQSEWVHSDHYDAKGFTVLGNKIKLAYKLYPGTFEAEEVLQFLSKNTFMEKIVFVSLLGWEGILYF